MYTSRKQTDEGRNFWMRRVDEALNQTNYYVYYIKPFVNDKFDMKAFENYITITKDSWHDIKSKIWGELNRIY